MDTPHPTAVRQAKSRKRRPAFAYAALSSVSLTHDVSVEELGGRVLPAGSRGTVVAAYSDGLGYEVEFNAPFHVVATLDAADLRA